MKLTNGAIKIEVGSATRTSSDEQKSGNKAVQLPENSGAKDDIERQQVGADLESKVNNQNGRPLCVDHRNEPASNSKLVYLAPSGSSCVTDAEISPVSSNTSSSDTIEPVMGTIMEAKQQQQQQQEQQSARILSQLVVETTTTASNTTTVSTTAAPTKMLASRGPGNACPVKQPQPHNRDLESQRSASTCGALELYACSVGDKTCSRPKMIQSSLTMSGQDLTKSGSAPNHQARHSVGLSGASSTMNMLANNDDNNNNNKPNGEKPTTRAGGRSIGSTTLAPFQIVKLQATKRQLNQNETTTRLLIAVMIVFLICESPAGILSVLCAVFGQEFFDNVYQPMGILTDLLALINSSVNFVLYCFMSTQFRVTFYQVVLHCPAPKQPSARNHTNINNNNNSFKNKNITTREANNY